MNNLDEYQSRCLRTWNLAKTTKEDMLNVALGLAGESGEFADTVKKWAFHGPNHPFPDIAEIGDILYYVAIAAWCMGFNLSEVAEMNINKLLTRYPDGFDSVRSVNRAGDGS